MHFHRRSGNHAMAGASSVAADAMAVAALGLAWTGAGRDPAADSAVRENRPADSMA